MGFTAPGVLLLVERYSEACIKIIPYFPSLDIVCNIFSEACIIQVNCLPGPMALGVVPPVGGYLDVSIEIIPYFASLDVMYIAFSEA